MVLGLYGAIPPEVPSPLTFIGQCRFGQQLLTIQARFAMVMIMADKRSNPDVSRATLEQLQQIDACEVSNAIEHFRVRTRNEGFVNSSVRCMFPELKPRVGYAFTACIRTSSTPVTG